MANYKTAVMKFLDQQSIRYTDVDRTMLQVKFQGENISKIEVTLFFAEDGGNDVSIISWSLGSVKNDGQYSKAVVFCNEMNAKWRWVKFCVNNDRDVVVQAEAYIDIASAGQEIYDLITNVVLRVDDAYPEFMKLMA